MVAPLVLAAIPSLISLLGKQGWFGSTGEGSTTKNAEDLMSPEQLAAYKKFVELSGSGGESYGGAMGNYDIGATGQAGISKIGSMLEAGIPGIFEAGKSEINRVLTGSDYDPYSATGEYSGLKRNILREQTEQQGLLNRQAALTGNASSSWRGKETGLLAERTGNKLSDTMASLYDKYTQRKIDAAKTAADMGSTEQNMNLNLAGAGLNADAIVREQKNAEATGKYNEWLRTQGVKLDALKSVLGTGVGTVTTYQDNSWTKLLNDTLTDFGKAYANKYATA